MVFVEGETADAVAEGCADDEIDVAPYFDVRGAVDGIAGLEIAAHGGADGVDGLVAAVVVGLDAAAVASRKHHYPDIRGCMAELFRRLAELDFIESQFDFRIS